MLAGMRLRPGNLLAIWVASGAALAACAVLAWMSPATVRGWLEAVQRAYGTGPGTGWALRSDTHAHIAVALVLTLWFGLGCRLFAPRHLLWAAPALTVLVALFDELAQLGSPERSFDWGDQAAGAVGIILALPLLMLLRRVAVGQPQR